MFPEKSKKKKQIHIYFPFLPPFQTPFINLHCKGLNFILITYACIYPLLYCNLRALVNWNTVESLQFVVTQVLWYSRVALLHEVNSSRKTFFSIIEIWRIRKITSPRKTKKSHNQLKLAPTNSTVIKHFNLLINVWKDNELIKCKYKDLADAKQY